MTGLRKHWPVSRMIHPLDNMTVQTSTLEQLKQLLLTVASRIWHIFILPLWIWVSSSSEYLTLSYWQHQKLHHQLFKHHFRQDKSSLHCSYKGNNCTNDMMFIFWHSEPKLRMIRIHWRKDFRASAMFRNQKNKTEFSFALPLDTFEVTKSGYFPFTLFSHLKKRYRPMSTFLGLLAVCLSVHQPQVGDPFHWDETWRHRKAQEAEHKCSWTQVQLNSTTFAEEK